MPAIQPLSYSALDYLKSFGVVAVCVSASGKVYVSRNPQGAVSVWWCKSEHDADVIARVAWADADVCGAAAKLGKSLTPHATVLRRTAERVAKIDEAIATAIDAGTLREFNSTYRRLRLQAKQGGKPFMSYSQVQARLRKVIAGAVARGGEIPPSFIASVFEQS